jgi:hypothetical protein
MKYQNHILAMQEIDGFYSQYCRTLGDYSKNEDSYEATERLFESHFGKRKYKNFESFKSALSQYLKKRKDASKQL